MLLSQILPLMGAENKCQLVNDYSFDTLGLIESETELSICTFLDDKKYINKLSKHIKMIITTKDIVEAIRNEIEVGNLYAGVAIADNPRGFFFELHNFLSGMSQYARPYKKTVIDPSAQISPLAWISPDGVRIGKNVIIEPFVSIYQGTEIDSDVIIRSGARVGGVGFEFKREGDSILAVEHSGGVKIGKHVEIQNNTCIDKAVYPGDNTVIGDYCKIDNLVHIAHAVKLEDSVMVVANSGIGGRVLVGKNTWIGFGATLKNGIRVGENSRANMGSVVTKSIKDGESVSGNFAIEHSKFIENIKNLSNNN